MVPIVPLVASGGTMAVICVSESTVKLISHLHARVTYIAPVKLSPVMTTLVPTGPLVGEKLKTCGVTRKILLLVKAPPGSVTVMLPVVAPGGTVAFRYVSDSTVKDAGAPLKETPVAPLNPWPRISTTPPTGRAAGRKVTNGARPTERLNTVPQPSVGQSP